MSESSAGLARPIVDAASSHAGCHGRLDRSRQQRVLLLGQAYGGLVASAAINARTRHSRTPTPEVRI